MTKAKVLYIEDDSASRRLVNRLLSSSGYEVLTAADGFEGVALAHQVHPHLILMDINLPQMDGRALTTRLRSCPTFTHTPIVALTALRDTENRNLALAAGCTGFLSKPIDVDIFPQQIESFLNGQQQKLNKREHQKHLEKHTQALVCQLEEKVRELEDANRHMQELNELKSDFLLMACQDMQEPLVLTRQNLDILQTHLLQTKNGPEQASLLNLVQRMQNGTKRMAGLIQEMDQVAAVMSGLLKLNVTEVHLGELVADVVADVVDVCERRHLHLSLGSMKHVPTIHGDAAQLHTAVSNIIGNAIKFTPDGGYIAITAHITETEICLCVQDTGLGIPKEEQRYIFDLFYALGHVDNHSTSKSAFCGGGLGLGLPLAKGIIEAHNGRILVTSDPDLHPHLPGSTFTICLPRS